MSTNNNQIILNIRFTIKPGKKESFRESLFSMISNFKMLLSPMILSSMRSGGVQKKLDATRTK
ncbi:hypothetical protein DFQ00_10630 [Paenibacillus barcinonensis]|uniref:Uncharacterized protein n=1 Tax=Paenibacillus barcinonensis TaxID=198119 RepID=A0A2V4VR11_PAEBA|nr:hypothetical protein DFQ00_10630 [Paenibacillus barcinonensis]